MNMMIKSLKEISLPISEEEYRNDGCIHYSTLAKFNRDGFKSLSSLYDRIDTPSLTFGSAVDSIITGGQKEFEERFFVCDFPAISDTLKKVSNSLFADFGKDCINIQDIPENDIKAVCTIYDYGKSWKPPTVASKVIESCEQYYSMLHLAGDKKILSSEEYDDVINTVKVLKESPQTEYFFRPDEPFNLDGIERLYQLKFKATFNNINYSNMADLIIVDHNKKVVYPYDLKTSGHKEYEFYKSFIDWGY